MQLSPSSERVFDNQGIAMLRSLFTVAFKLYQCHSATISISQRTLMSSIQATQPLYHQLAYTHNKQP
jgi:hypothetical protein